MLVRLYTNAQKVKRIIHQESLWRMLTVGQLTTSFGESCTFYGLLAHQLCLLNVPLKWKDFQEFPHPLIRTGSQCPNWWKRTGTQISIMKNTFLQLKKNTLKDFKEHSFRTLKISFLIVSNFYIEFTNLNGKKVIPMPFILSSFVIIMDTFLILWILKLSWRKIALYT